MTGRPSDSDVWSESTVEGSTGTGSVEGRHQESEGPTFHSRDPVHQRGTTLLVPLPLDHVVSRPRVILDKPTTVTPLTTRDQGRRRGGSFKGTGTERIQPPTHPSQCPCPRPKTSEPRSLTTEHRRRVLSSTQTGERSRIWSGSLESEESERDPWGPFP